MNETPRPTPEVVKHRIPRIEVYEVTQEELSRLEEGCNKVGQDLTFATVALTLVVAFTLALLTNSVVSEAFLSIVILDIISAVVAIYTGSRWWRVRKIAPAVLTQIRSRRSDPDAPPAT